MFIRLVFFAQMAVAAVADVLTALQIIFNPKKIKPSGCRFGHRTSRTARPCRMEIFHLEVLPFRGVEDKPMKRIPVRTTRR